MNEQVTISQEEYEALKATRAAIKMVEIPEAELRDLKAERDRLSSRNRELEMLLRREMDEHAAEYNALLARVTGAPG